MTDARGDTLPATRPGGGRQASTSPYLFVIACGTSARVRPARIALRQIDEVELRRGDATDVDPSSRRPRKVAIGIPDLRMSSAHARFVFVEGAWHVEDLGSRNGTFVNGARIEHATLADGDVIDAGDTVLRYREHLPHVAGEVVHTLHTEVPRGLGSLLPEIQQQLDELRRAAGSTLTILIQGETGTGKELVARAIHAESKRPGPLIAVNCGALPRERIAAELFGWRRGAFPGAIADHPGLVRASDGGTLLLDEIGDLPLAEQAALLRVLQEREVLPIAGTRPIGVDLRVVAATHQPLDSLVETARFRRDLLARLAGFRAVLPPLRDRCEDLGILVGDLLRARGAETASIRAATWRALLAHPWPANIRELEHALGRALLQPGGALAVALDRPAADVRRPQEDHRDRLVALMRTHAGNIAAVARDLGKARMQVQRWLRRYEIDPEDYRVP